MIALSWAQTLFGLEPPGGRRWLAQLFPLKKR